MLSYVVALAAFLLFFLNPLANILGIPLSSLTSPRDASNPSNNHRRRHSALRPILNESLIALEAPPDSPEAQALRSCPDDAYAVHVLSKEPLVLYIEGFLSADERSHLLEVSEPLFQPSTVTNDGGASTKRDENVRLSSVAVVPRTAGVRCVEERARALQGWRGELWVERLRTQLYGVGGHYRHHYDWSSNAGGWGRVSSMMVWVKGDSDGEGEGEGGVEGGGDRVEGGGTDFPLLSLVGDKKRWCRFVECGEAKEGEGEGEQGKGKGKGENPDRRQDDAQPQGGGEGGEGRGGRGGDGGAGVDGPSGVTFKVKAGNAVYWENFRADGSWEPYDETWHAGLPVTKGTKVGLNIWSWGRIDPVD